MKKKLALWRSTDQSLPTYGYSQLLMASRSKDILGGKMYAMRNCEAKVSKSDGSAHSEPADPDLYFEFKSKPLGGTIEFRRLRSENPRGFDLLEAR